MSLSLDWNKISKFQIRNQTSVAISFSYCTRVDFRFQNRQWNKLDTWLYACFGLLCPTLNLLCSSNTKRKSPHIFMFAINMLISVQCSVFTWVHVVCWWCMLVHFVCSIWLRYYNVVFYLCSFLFNFFECIATSNLSVFNWKLLRSILYAVWIVKCP